MIMGMCFHFKIRGGDAQRDGCVMRDEEEEEMGA